MKRNLAVSLTILWLLFLATSLSGAHVMPLEAAPALQTNLLSNPGFEEPYSRGTAQGWSPWHQGLNDNPKPANCSERYLVQPSWEPELASQSLILEGARSQHVGNNFDTWRAGVMHTLNVTPGSTYRFTFWALGRASNDQFPAPSNFEVNMGVRGGIDPNGSGLWNDGDVVWGAAGSPHDSGNQTNWQQFTTEATATGNRITVFVQADFGGANQCRTHLDVWFDKAELIEVGPPPTNTSPPLPTSPPVINTPVPPTATALPETTPTETLVPTVTPTHTPPPPEGGVICTNAFADENANGQKDPDEGYMAGVTFTIAQGDSVVAQGISTGTETPVCFENTPPETYLVAQVLPRNLEATTESQAQIDVSADTTVSLAFGSRVREDSEGEEIASATPTSEAPTSPDSSPDGDGNGLSALAIIGLLAILLAIVLLGVLIFLLVRQQSA
jgi:hypothetical protein